jgi:hypothetical protein
MVNCNDGRFNCGPTIASACVNYTGQPLKTVLLTSLSCTPNINDILYQLDSVIFSIKQGLDLTHLKPCKIDFNPEKIQINQLFQIIIDRLSDIQTQLTCLQKDVKSSNILNETINIDLSCLFGGTSCNTTNTYTVATLLSTLVTQICQLKNQVNQ